MSVATVINARVPVKIFTDEVDAATLQQLRNTASLPCVHPFVAAMPDVHLGKGATVGSVIPTRGAVIPAAVGVDIGCGMNAVRLSLRAEDLPDSLRRMRAAIEDRVPVGPDSHGEGRPPGEAQFRPLAQELAKILEKHPIISPGDRQRPLTQLGTLGGGNHFIELCLDEAGRVWVMLHSGSRGIGNRIGTYFIERAREEMGARLGSLPDRDLAYLSEGAPAFDDYTTAVDWAQRYARANRAVMMDLIIDALRAELPPFEITTEAINCHHNYVQPETWQGETLYVTRKGAISARQGELGIIPGSMGARSYIVRGLGNPESLYSCAHGAGRRMSRNQAKRTVSLAELAQQTEGVECRRDRGVLDEAPGAYKDIDTVMANQRDLVEVVHTLKQVLCVKG